MSFTVLETATPKIRAISARAAVSASAWLFPIPLPVRYSARGYALSGERAHWGGGAEAQLLKDAKKRRLQTA